MGPLLITDDEATRREVLSAAHGAGVEVQVATAGLNRAGVAALLHEHTWYPLLLGPDAVTTVADHLTVTDDVIVVGTDAKAVHSAAKKVQRTIAVTMLVLPNAAAALAKMLEASIQNRVAA